GKAKGGKTSLLVLFVAAYLCGGIEEIKAGESPGYVLFIDAEQGSWYASQTLRRIYALSNGKGTDRLVYMDWRVHSWQERRALLRAAVEERDYTFIIIDGARD